MVSEFRTNVVIDPTANKEEALAYAKFVINTMAKVVRLGGGLVSDEQAQARYDNACKGCDYAQMHYYTPLVAFERCSVCKCPLETKTKTYKNFRLRELQMVVTTCPHPEKGNLWAEIDQKFNL